MCFRSVSTTTVWTASAVMLVCASRCFVGKDLEERPCIGHILVDWMEWTMKGVFWWTALAGQVLGTGSSHRVCRCACLCCCPDNPVARSTRVMNVCCSRLVHAADSSLFMSRGTPTSKGRTGQLAGAMRRQRWCQDGVVGIRDARQSLVKLSQ